MRRDLRLSYSETYGSYYYLNIRSFVGDSGDCYDRFLIRMREMVESIHIILQVINEWGDCNFTGGIDGMLRARSSSSSRRQSAASWIGGMEDLITHFKYFSGGEGLPRGIAYRAVESAKGEFGTFIAADNSPKPFRCRIRAPAYYHAQLFGPMVQGHYFADLITIVGSQDIVMGEVDRLDLI